MKPKFMPFDTAPGLIGGAPKARKPEAIVPPKMRQPAPQSGMEQAMSAKADEMHRPRK